MLKIILTYIGVLAAFFCFFFFYPAEIFEATILESGANYSIDISLRAFMNWDFLPEAVSTTRVADVIPTWKGWFLLVICLIGVPLMIAYRILLMQAEKNN
ncbi:hypothetical protein [Crocinitomix catalasitica]|uniref:hypothetical protein n=1 Tax=Crocinitomix catalasitica TaxID=184607 RepID=UPI000482DB65|nr:hypothetical protein [Crocinitomix catalasitica]